MIAEKGGEYRFVGISLDEQGLEEFMTKHDLGIPIYTGVSDDVKMEYKMFGTPQTIVVSPEAVVVASWSGVYRGKQKEAVEDFFKVKLPDIDLKTTH